LSILVSPRSHEGIISKIAADIRLNDFTIDAFSFDKILVHTRGFTLVMITLGLTLWFTLGFTLWFTIIISWVAERHFVHRVRGSTK
jgi:hypothetical protein